MDGGTHEVGFKNALTKVMNEYGKKFNLLKDNTRLLGDDVREGLTAIISVKLTECEFEGQTKGRLGNPAVKPFIEKLVTEKLMNFLEENPAAFPSTTKYFTATTATGMASRICRQP